MSALPASDRDILWLRPPEDENGHDPAEPLRQALTDQLDALIASVESELAALRARSQEGELDDALACLEDQLTALEGDRLAVSTAGPAALAMLYGTVAAQAAATVVATGQAASTATLQSGVTFAEMTTDQLTAAMNTLREQADAFFAHQAESHAEVLAAAATNGVDLSAYATTVDQLRAERDRAAARGDTVRIAMLDAQLAALEAGAARRAGMDEAEIAERDTAQEETAARLRDALEIQARRDAAAQGLTGPATETYVESAVQQGLQTFAGRLARCQQEADLSGDEQALEQTAERAAIDAAYLIENTTAREDQLGIDFSEAPNIGEPETPDSIPVQRTVADLQPTADQPMVSAADLGIALNLVGTEADPAEPLTPSQVADVRPPQPDSPGRPA